MSGKPITEEDAARVSSLVEHVGWYFNREEAEVYWNLLTADLARYHLDLHQVVWRGMLAIGELCEPNDVEVAGPIITAPCANTNTWRSIGEELLAVDLTTYERAFVRFCLSMGSLTPAELLALSEISYERLSTYQGEWSVEGNVSEFGADDSSVLETGEPAKPSWLLEREAAQPVLPL